MSAVDFERWRQQFADMIENLVGRRIDYSQLYPAAVVSQNSDGTLQVIPDSPKIQGTGMNNVRIRHGLPGTAVVVSQGARVRIGFENGDPSQPFAGLWDTDAAFVTITFAGGVQALARQGDLVQSGGAGTTVIFTPVPGSPTPMAPGAPYFISFSADPLAVGPLAAPLFGTVSTGQPKLIG